jgi:hypothetical protein
VGVLDLFWLICKIAAALGMFAALCYGAYRAYAAFNGVVRAKRLRPVRQWILSLDKAQLLALMLEPDTGLDKQDLDGLVQLAFESYPEGCKDAIVDRLAEHLNRP